MKNLIFPLFLYVSLCMPVAKAMLAPLGNNYTTLFQEAHQALAEQDYSKAFTNLTWLTLYDTHHERKMVARVLLGGVYNVKKQYKMAQFFFNCALNDSKCGETQALAAYGIAQLACKKNKLEKAAHYYLKAAQYSTHPTHKHDRYSNYFKVMSILSSWPYTNGPDTSKCTFDNTEEDEVQLQPKKHKISEDSFLI